MLETDYLIIGSGAVGMAFADTLLTETDAHITIVDRYAKPGGHWNVAYSFVNLHQPSQFYGVNSRELSNGCKDAVGLNKGLYDLATGAQVCAYFDEVMRNTFLPSGRVKYFPLCDYKGDYSFESMLSGKQYQVQVRKKVVDCTYLYTSVPATHIPNFAIADGVHFIPLNDLVSIKNPPAGFVIIGGGKTGIDACLWLLENEVDPEDISWIVSRDGWMLDRQNTQPTEEFFEYSMGAQAAQMEAIAQATSIPDLFERLEKAGVLLRLDTSVEPRMFHGATISKLELEQLRRIKKVIRMGRVKQIEKEEIILENGSIPTTTEHVHVDCSASAITNFETKPIFEGELITPQTVRPYQPVFSAAFIAHVEAAYEGDKTKNKLCQIVPLPDHHTDWLRTMAMQMVNQISWSQDKELRNWLRNSRLDGFSRMVKNVDRNDPQKMAILQRMRSNAMPAMVNLQKLIGEMEAKNQSDMKDAQFQVQQKMFMKNRLVEMPADATELQEGEILVKIEKFGYSANNITYAAAGDVIGYWQFFPPYGKEVDGWGVIPVWGFAEVVESTVDDIVVGERLFGYFPPATHLKMKPTRVSQRGFIEGSEHRAELPAGYNRYTRVKHEKGYDPTFDRERMLLYPLYLTGYFLWDSLQENHWYDAKQIVILSASSKTSIGLAYALKADKNSPKVIGVTSQSNLEMVQSLGLYDHGITYDQIQEIDADTPTVIVDMSGNNKVMAALHTHLADNMKWTVKVGLTHWADTRPEEGVINARSKFFFAPSHIQKRLKEWSPAEFEQKTTTFLMETIAKSQKWLKFKKLDGLSELAKIHPDVCAGKIQPEQGLIVMM